MSHERTRGQRRGRTPLAAVSRQPLRNQRDQAPAEL